MISSYELNKKEPETFSAIAGSEIYQIPALITKKKGIGQWFVGEEAVRLAIAQGEEANGRLLSRAVGGEKVFVDGETYPAEELLTLYLKKLIRLACGPDRRWEPDRLVICMEKLSREATELFLSMAPKDVYKRQQEISSATNTTAKNIEEQNNMTQSIQSAICLLYTSRCV